MKAFYLVKIDEASHHWVKVHLKLTGNFAASLTVFLPSWSPGSYLMREYSRHLQALRCEGSLGEAIDFEQCAKGQWQLDFKDKNYEEIHLYYQVYCHELTVRTSHINSEHAFLHGPSYLMGVKGERLEGAQLQLKFPALWSKVTCPLKEISQVRDEFIYESEDYDHLLDSPIEIGCHSTDGFYYAGKEHALAHFGTLWFDQTQLKNDIHKIVEYIGNYMGEIPYENYYFINHFIPGGYGGLEHHDSTVLQFDGRLLEKRGEYVKWLQLVAHEYFHTWNVKRIRPKELGPFEYTEENYTSMLWLAEGLTSFMDNYFVFKAGLCTEQEYLKTLSNDFQRFQQTVGKKFDSLEMSSFNAWIKLYRPHENSQNSTISYYLKGGLVFLVLHILLKKNGSDIKDLIHALWQDYKKRPSRGITKEEFSQILLTLIPKDDFEKWISMIETTEDIDFSYYLKHVGLEIVEKREEKCHLGLEVKAFHGRLMIEKVSLDSPAYRAGLNAGDEILAIDHCRVLPSEWSKIEEIMQENQSTEWLIARNQMVQNLTVSAGCPIKKIEEIRVIDPVKFKGF